MRHIVTDVSGHTHHVERCVDGLDLELAIAFIRLPDIVLRLYLQPVAINHEVNIRVVARAGSNCGALVNFVGDPGDAIELLDERFVPEDGEEDARRSRIKDGVDTSIDLRALFHHIIGVCVGII